MRAPQIVNPACAIKAPSNPEPVVVVAPFPPDRSSSLRRAFLGAAAAATISGAGLAEIAGGYAAAAAAESSGPASFADVVDRVKGAVVSVKVKLSEVGEDEDESRPPSFPQGGPLERFFHRFGMPRPDGPGGTPRDPASAQGSGFFISADGYVVTNNHVVEHASTVTITTDGGKALTARVIGTDPKTDLALLKVEGADFPAVRFAAKSPRVGDWVIAVGNPFGLGGTVTAGIVSARGRDIGSGPFDDFIQIDAPVNHGNSGGPAFNNEGEVVGVNTAIFSPSGGSVGIGFAIASDVVQSVVAQLKDHGAVARGWLGVEIQPLTPDLADSLGVKSEVGALVAKASPQSPAAQAGVKAGDVIVAINGESVASPRELARRIAAYGPKTSVSLTLSRDGQTQKLEVSLGAMPSDRATVALASPPAPAETAFGKLGLRLEPLKGGGVRIAGVVEGGLAAERGLAEGDVIVEAGGKAMEKPADVKTAFDEARNLGRKSVLLRVRSDQSVRFVALPAKGAE
jgi:serine protease Do